MPVFRFSYLLRASVNAYWPFSVHWGFFRYSAKTRASSPSIINPSSIGAAIKNTFIIYMMYYLQVTSNEYTVFVHVTNIVIGVYPQYKRAYPTNVLSIKYHIQTHLTSRQFSTCHQNEKSKDWFSDPFCDRHLNLQYPVIDRVLNSYMRLFLYLMPLLSRPSTSWLRLF